MTTPNEHHPSLDELCDIITRILVGKQSKVLKDTTTDNEAGLFIGPTWIWQESRTDIGRKDKKPHGGKYLMPIRVQYETGDMPLLVPVDNPVDIPWTAIGNGHHLSGIIHITCNSDTGLETFTFDTDTQMPTSVELTPQAPHHIKQRLTDLTTLGSEAEWAFRANSEGFVRNTIHLAHSRVAYGLAETGTHGPVVDEVKLAQLCDEIVIGTDDRPGAVTHLIARLLQPKTFQRVDPLRYVTVSLKRDAEDAIRRELGDPRIGTTLRRFVATRQPSNLKELLTMWNDQYPNNRIGMERAIAALTVGPTVMALDNEFNDEISVPDHE